MKKSFAVVIVLFSSLVLLAQTPPPRPAGAPGHAGPHAGQNEKLFEFLQLTAEQKSAWQAVHDDARPSFEALASRQREAHEQMRTAMDASAPDACTVGRLLIQVEAAGTERKALNEATEKKAVALLNAEQRTKFDAWKAARQEADMRMRTARP